MHRVKNFQSKLKEMGCDACIVEEVTDLYYLTGIEVSVGKLILDSSQAFFLVDSRYFEMAKAGCEVPVLLSDNHTLTETLKTMGPIKTLGFDSQTTTYTSYQQLQSMAEGFQDLSLVPVKSPVQTLRSIKETDEISLLREAAILGSEGYDFVQTLLKEGITEIEVAIELEIFWKKRGSRGLAFDPIIAFGANSSMPHYRAGNGKLKQGDTVLIDIGVNVKHYHSDMTRTLFFGEPPPVMKKIYQIVLKAQLEALKLCRPGIAIGELDRTARSVIDLAGYGPHFSHGLGHGVGLEIHELPVVRNKPPFDQIVLQPGMVITIEPGIYLPNVGGVRIEDTIVITEQGHENLTNRDKNLFILN